MPPSSPACGLEGETRLAATGLAHRSIDIWLADSARSGLAQRSAKDCLRKRTMQRVDAVLEHDLPSAANQRWLCDTVRAWAPLEVLFPSKIWSGTRGVTGELAGHLVLIVKREYGHVASGLRPFPRARELLQAEAQHLALQLEIGASLRPLLESEASHEDWLNPYIDMSLAMAEYLHRNVIGLSQVLPDSMVMRYATGISRTQQSLRAACRRTPQPAAHGLN